MRPVKVSFIGDAADEWERLNKAVAEERSGGMENSENQQLLKSIKQDRANKNEPPVWKLRPKETYT